MLLKNTTNKTATAKMAQRSSFVDVVQKYKWAINNANINIAKKLGLTRNKKF